MYLYICNIELNFKIQQTMYVILSYFSYVLQGL